MEEELSNEKATHMLNTVETVAWLLAEHCEQGKFAVLTTLLGGLIKARGYEQDTAEMVACLHAGFDEEELPKELEYILSLLKADEIPLSTSQAMTTYLLSKKPHEALSVTVSNLVSVARNMGLDKVEFEKVIDTARKGFEISLQLIPGKDKPAGTLTH